MVKSKINYRIQGGDIAGRLLTAVLLTFWMIVTYQSNHTGVQLVHWYREMVEITFIALGVIVFLVSATNIAVLIIITDKSVINKNWITRRERIYKFEDFDDFVQRVEPNKPIGCPDIFLLEDKMIFW